MATVSVSLPDFHQATAGLLTEVNEFTIFFYWYFIFRRHSKILK